MSEKFLVAPSILSADFANLGRDINGVIDAGADWIHIDVMDGHFVPNITIGAPVVKSLRKNHPRAVLDCHLMISDPEDYVEEFAAAGADYITIHVEACSGLEKMDQPSNPEKVRQLLEKIRSLGVKSGITARPATSVEEILPVLDVVDLALVMTVNPGFGGQKFMQDQVSKIKIIREKLNELGSEALIEVDGGVTDETAKFCSDADVLVAGSYVFKNDFKEAIQKLKEARQ